MFSNKTLNCCDCRVDFEFTVGEQEFFNLKGLTNVPKRCANCRRKPETKCQQDQDASKDSVLTPA